jgi:hypothetical protein
MRDDIRAHARRANRLAALSAESIRVGANWRKSAFPQRPAPVPAVSPLGR